MTGVNVVWASSDPSVATVDANGLVTAGDNGTTTVAASAGSVSGNAEVTVAQEASAADRSALEVLYRMTGETRWIHKKNWLTDAPLDTWYGVVVSGGRVTELRLRGNHLTGPIPAALGDLSRLEHLDLSENNLSGPIPPELARLSHLRRLDLYGSDVTGTIPPELGDLSRLEHLDLSANHLTGAIPSELGRLSRLNWVSLSRNSLTGPIPPEFGNLAGLEALYLYANSLTGTVPPELGALANLAVLALDDNRLTGAMPASFLGLGRLGSFRIGDNGGLCIPGTADFVAWWQAIDRTEGPLCNMADVAALNALYEATAGAAWINADGWLEGETVSAWHGVAADSIGRVAALDLSRNGLSGELPGQLGNLTAMTRLRLDGNALSGSLPLSLTATPLEEFRYSDTDLCVPADASFREWLNGIAARDAATECDPLSERDVLVALYDATGGPNWKDAGNWLTQTPLEDWYGVEVTDGSVSALRLGGNGLAGTIPAELGRLAHLAVLDLSDNAITGPIPPNLGDLRSLRDLSLRNNRLSGPIPPTLRKLTNLWYLSLGTNSLRGPIPPELGNLSTLRSLVLSDNALSGSIPEALGDLSSLQTLHLDANRLSDPIPAALGNLSSLLYLYLNGNALSGPIPAELGNLPRLSILSLFDNALSGPIPAELGNLSSLLYLYLNGNALSGPIPAELGNLSGLSILSLYDNALSGSIPARLGNMTELELFDVRTNALTGPIPAELGSLSRLSELSLADNDLTGSIPAQFSGMLALERLSVAHNRRMSGPLPASLTALRRLEVLQASGTDLCAPPEHDFGIWLNGIRTRWIAVCAEVEGSAAHLTQAVQSFRFPVPLMANEKALLRVFITAPDAAGAAIPPVRARFFTGGSETYVANIPAGSAAIPEETDQGSLIASANAEIPASVIVPGLEMVVEIDPDGTLDPELPLQRRIPETGRTAVDVQTLPRLDLTVIPFLWSAAPDSSILDLTHGLDGDRDIFLNTRTLLPVADLDVSVHEPVMTDRNGAFDLFEVTEAIRVLEGGAGHYMGTMTGELGSSFIGAAAEPGRSLFSIWRADVVAHELGHNMSLAHAPCGGAARPDPAFPQRDGSIGDWGDDFVTGELVPPTMPDLMSYCGPPDWASGFSFTKALRFRQFDEGGTAAAVAGPAKSLLFWGGVDATGVPFLEPAFVVEAPPSPPQPYGEYEIAGRTASDEQLFSTKVAMAAVADAGGRSAFALAVPIESGWADALASVTLSGPGGVATLDDGTDRPAIILRDRHSGRVRGFLLDSPAIAAAAAGGASSSVDPGIEVLFSRGIPAPAAWRR